MTRALSFALFALVLWLALAFLVGGVVARELAARGSAWAQVAEWGGASAAVGAVALALVMLLTKGRE